MARDTKPKKTAGRGVSVSDVRRKKPSRKGGRDDDTKTKGGGNSDKVAAESLKTRQMQSSKEFEGTETCRLNFKTNPAALDRDRPLSRLQLQRFEEFTRDAVTKGLCSHRYYKKCI
uniref:Uncharacterized protein n=1 Tax=Panagrolaimus superbus TaxID=310955 RepID=A0A914XYT6_9BILA